MEATEKMKQLLSLKKQIELKGLIPETLDYYQKLMNEFDYNNKINALNNSALNHIDAVVCDIFEKTFDPKTRLNNEAN